MVEPPDHVVRLMKERAVRLTSAKGTDRDIDLARIERALIEAWAEGVIHGQK